MYFTLRNIYFQGRIGKTELDKAVQKNWITEEQKNMIIEDKPKEGTSLY